MQRRQFINVIMGGVGVAYLPPLLASPSAQSLLERELEHYFSGKLSIDEHQVDIEIAGKKPGFSELRITHAPDGVWCSIDGVGLARELALKDMRFRGAAVFAICSCRHPLEELVKARGSMPIPDEDIIRMASARSMIQVGLNQGDYAGLVRVRREGRRHYRSELPGIDELIDPFFYNQIYHIHASYVARTLS